MSGPLNCAETFRRLDDYVDRELSADERTAVESHLETCAICAGEFAVEHELLEGIRAKLVRLQLPAGFMERISARLNAPSSPRRGAPGAGPATPAGGPGPPG